MAQNVKWRENLEIREKIKDSTIINYYSHFLSFDSKLKIQFFKF